LIMRCAGFHEWISVLPRFAVPRAIRVCGQ
jgi:hypothetical protein